MKDKFTKGPWRSLPEECDKPYIRIRGTVLGGRYKVCNVLTPVYEGVHDRGAIETRANAALIAAAPEMYAKLNEISDGLLDAGGLGNCRLAKEIESLLSKARGES